MEFETALGLAVISCWEDMVKPNEDCAIHIEYPNVAGNLVESLKVWTVTHGHWTLVCDYSTIVSRTFPVLGVHFENSFHSEMLARNLAFIMEHQRQLTRRAAGSSENGIVQVSLPNGVERANAAAWSAEMTAGRVAA
jgi:hypothetical protein